MDSPHYAEHHPYWFIVVLEIMIIAVYFLSGAVAYLVGLPSMILYGIANVILTIIGIIMLSVMHWWKRVGFRAPAQPRHLLLFLVWLIPIGLNLAFGVEIGNPVQAGILLLIALLVGFVEEGFFRGLMFQALRHVGPWQTIILTSLLFGVTHALNVLTGRNPLDAVLQIGYAIAIGIGCGALVWRTGIIWPLVLGHAFTDFASFIQPAALQLTPAANNLILLAIIVVFAGYGLYLMVSRPAEQAASPAETPADNPEGRGRTRMNADGRG